MKDTIEWAAGLFEGEGNIYRNDILRVLKMSVKMKDEDIVKRFCKCVNCGKVVKMKSYKGYAPMWDWRLGQTNYVLRLAPQFLPFMGQRRTKQILKALEGKHFIKEKQILKKVSECNYMRKGEISTRGAKMHVRKGEKPCIRCAENQREYLNIQEQLKSNHAQHGKR